MVEVVSWKYWERQRKRDRGNRPQGRMWARLVEIIKLDELAESCLG